MRHLLLSSLLLCAACGSPSSNAAGDSGSAGERYEVGAGSTGGVFGTGGDTRSSTGGVAGSTGGVFGTGGDTRSSTGGGVGSTGGVIGTGGDTRSSTGGGAGSTGGAGGDTRSSTGGGAGSTGGASGAGGDTRSSTGGSAGGTGGASGAMDGGVQPSDGSMPDAPAPADSGGGADVPSDAALLSIASQLQGFRVELPCDVMTTEAGVCTTTVAVDKQTHALAIGGETGTVYDVQLRVRGVVEWMTYSGCAAGTQAPFCIGGTKLDATFNIYSLSVPDPKQTYYFNWGATIEHAVYTVDYTVSVPMKGKSALTFSVDGQNQKEMANVTSLVVPGIPPAPQAYAGQFLQLDVVSVTAK